MFLHTNRGSRVGELAKNDQKRTKMGDFGNFLKNRSTGANKGPKIVSRVLFWVSINDLVPFLTKNRQFWGILGQILAPLTKAIFFVENRFVK